jgi:hypothetical protein
MALFSFIVIAMLCEYGGKPDLVMFNVYVPGIILWSSA